MTRAIRLPRLSPLLILAAALLALAVFSSAPAAPASAQTTGPKTTLKEVWSSTLTVGFTTGNIQGLWDNVHQNPRPIVIGALSPSSFTYGGRTYDVMQLHYIADNSSILRLTFPEANTASALKNSDLVLIVGDNRVSLSDGLLFDWRLSGDSIYWTISNPGWSMGDTVSVKLLTPVARTDSDLPQRGTAIWEATLTMRDLMDNNGQLGCATYDRFDAGDRCDDTSTLSQDTFYFAGAPGWSATDPESRGDNDWRTSRQYGGVRIRDLYTTSDAPGEPRKLAFGFTRDVLESLRNSATLVFDGREFPLKDGSISPQSPGAIEWADAGIPDNDYADDQVVQVGLYLNPVGPDVTEWQPTMKARNINNSDAKAGCGGDIDCGDPVVFGGNRFSVNAPKFGGLRSYSIKELSVEFVAQYGHSETIRRVTLTVDEGGATVNLNDTWLVLTANLQTIMLPIRSQDRIGDGTWTWVESSDALSWGPYSTVRVGIHANTTGLQTVRVYYDEMKNGQAVDGFPHWHIAREKPYSSDDWNGDRALLAVIPGEFVSLNTREKAITTHAKLLLRGDWPGSTIEYKKGNWNAPPTSGYLPVGANGLTGAIPLNAEKSNTYVWVKVTNGDQVHTHLVIIDPPPRTFSVNPEARVTEGEEAKVTVSLGSPATKGGVSFNVTTEYGDAGDTDEGTTAGDIGEIVSTVTIPEGQQSATIAVPTVDDEAVEEDESFTVTLTHVGEPLWAVEPGKTGTTTVTIVDNDEPPEGPEPWNIKVVPGDGTLTVTWNISSRDGYEDSEIWHVLRWSQEFGVWANPRDPRGVGKNDGLSVDPGVTTFTITGLRNDVATGVFIRSMVGHRNNMSERDGNSSEWVRTKGVHTTPVAPPNEAPTVESAIDDATIVNESGASHVSLSGVFTDADEDDLTVTATSSDESVATVSVSADHATLTVSAQARGTATVTVTADDGKDGTVEDSFTVTVKAAPVVANAIADVSALETGATHEVSLSGVFTDADGDTLTVTASSSSDAVTTVSVTADYSGLTLAGKGAGTATITVRARDPDGNSVSDAFDVTVPAAQQQQQQQQQQAVELPGPVTGLTVTGSAEDGVTVSWSAPESGGAPAGYIVHIRPEGGKQGSGTTKRPGADTTTVSFNNLKSGRTYEVWVRAQNETGKGERVHGSITLEQQQAVELPGPVAGLELTADGNTVTVSWSAPESGGAPDGYIVHVKPEDGGKGKTRTPKASKTQVTFENLKSGRTYEVWVRAQNETGKGERVHATITVPEA